MHEGLHEVSEEDVALPIGSRIKFYKMTLRGYPIDDEIRCLIDSLDTLEVSKGGTVESAIKA